MASKQGSRMIVGLDIGTIQVVDCPGDRTADGELEIVGIARTFTRLERRCWW